MHGGADGVVVHGEIVVDGADHHLAGIDAGAHLHLDPVHPPRLLGLRPDRPLHGQRRVGRPHRVVLLRQGRAEQRHDAVAQHLVDGPLVTVHRLHHRANRPIQDVARGFRVAALDELERALDVGEEHGHLLALALQRAARA